MGVELAAEISVKFREKKVVIVHSGHQLLPRAPLKAGEISKNFLLSHGVQIIWNDKVIAHTGLI